MSADKEPEAFRVDRTYFSLRGLTEPEDALEYWLTRRVEERLQALEFLRRTFYGDSAHGRIERVLEVVRLEHI